MMTKARIVIDLPHDLLERVWEEMARTGSSRNRAIAELIRRGLEGRDFYVCPFCGRHCRPGEEGCEHFDKDKVLFRRK